MSAVTCCPPSPRTQSDRFGWIELIRSTSNYVNDEICGFFFFEPGTWSKFAKLEHIQLETFMGLVKYVYSGAFSGHYVYLLEQVPKDYLKTGVKIHSIAMSKHNLRTAAVISSSLYEPISLASGESSFNK